MTEFPPEPAVVPGDAAVVRAFTAHSVRLFGAVGDGAPAVLVLLEGTRNADAAPAELSLLLTPEGALDLADSLDHAATLSLPGASS